MVEFVVLSLPTLIYLLVRRRHRGDARAVMGLTPGRAPIYLGAAGAAVLLALASWAALSLVPASLVHAPGPPGRSPGSWSPSLSQRSSEHSLRWADLLSRRC